MQNQYHSPRRLAKEYKKASNFSQIISPTPQPMQYSQFLQRIPKQHHFTKKQAKIAKIQGQELLQHPTQQYQQDRKVSLDTPDWWKGTIKYYKKQEKSVQKLPKLGSNRRIKQEKGYDVFNREKSQHEAFEQSKKRMSRPISPKVSGKIGEELDNLIIPRRKVNVSPKIGSTNLRNYQIKRPLLKIGKDNYVDTYSVF